jgi:hypothetical protein
VFNLGLILVVEILKDRAVHEFNFGVDPAVVALPVLSSYYSSVAKA